MPIIWFLCAIMIFSAVIFSEDQHSQSTILQNSELSAVAGNMLVFRNSVTSYAAAHPAVTGTVADADLSLPAWYKRNTSVSNFVSGGHSYVYYTGNDLAGLTSVLYNKTDHSSNVGTNKSGALHNPKKGNTGIVLPVQIPDQAVVIIQ